MLPGMLVGKDLSSLHPHAILKSIDTSKAETLPGVKAVVTRDDFLSEQCQGNDDWRSQPQRDGARKGLL